MRVTVTGSATERAWLRRLLVDAGVELADGPTGADVVIEIKPAAPKPVAAYERPGWSPGSSDPGIRAGSTDPASWYAEPLTARERQVLALLAEGLPNKGIAAALEISDQTVKFHVAAIIGKLGASNRTDAVRRAVRRGLVTL